MGRFPTLALLLLLALASLALATDVQSTSHALRREKPLANEPVLVVNALPVVALDEAPSAANDTNASVPTTAPIHHTTAPTPTRSYHEVFGLIFAALALCVTSNVADQSGIVSTVSNAGILTTIYTLVLNFDLQAAIALSAVTLTGRSLAIFVDNIRDSARDTAARPLIDWDLLLVVEPSLMIGVLLGIFLRNVALPGWLVSTILATALLVCGSLLLQASHRRTEEAPAPEVSINEESSLIDPAKRPATGPPPPFSVAIQTTPLSKLGVLFGVVFAIAVLQAALVVVVPLVLLGYLAYKAYKAGFDSYERQQLPRAAPGQGDLKWTIRIVRTVPAVAVVAGAAAGTFGFGSELIFVPFLVSAGLDGAVASATGATIVLLSSLLVALECVVLGSVGFTVWLIAMILGFAAKEFSHLALERALSESLRTPSFLAFSFACITLLAGVALAIAST